MTIKRLKELIEYMPDDARIYLDDGDRMFEGNSEVIFAVQGALQYRDKVILQTKNDFDVEEELEARLDYYSSNDWDELDAVMDLLDDGFVIDDFKYNDDRYLWIKEFAEDHGLI